MNPGNIMKLMNAKNKFSQNHPKFVAFLQNVFGIGIQEGTIIEITVKRPEQSEVTANIKICQSDLELLEELKNMR